MSESIASMTVDILHRLAVVNLDTFGSLSRRIKSVVSVRRGFMSADLASSKCDRTGQHKWTASWRQHFESPPDHRPDSDRSATCDRAVTNGLTIVGCSGYKEGARLGLEAVPMKN